MSTVRLTNAEIRARGWDALISGVGPSGALRFAMQTERGQGNYAARRHRMLGRLSVDEEHEALCSRGTPRVLGDAAERT